MGTSSTNAGMIWDFWSLLRDTQHIPTYLIHILDTSLHTPHTTTYQLNICTYPTLSNISHTPLHTIHTHCKFYTPLHTAHIPKYPTSSNILHSPHTSIANFTHPYIPNTPATNSTHSYISHTLATNSTHSYIPTFACLTSHSIKWCGTISETASACARWWLPTVPATYSPLFTRSLRIQTPALKHMTHLLSSSVCKSMRICTAH